LPLSHLRFSIKSLEEKYVMGCLSHFQRVVIGHFIFAYCEFVILHMMLQTRSMIRNRETTETKASFRSRNTNARKKINGTVQNQTAMLRPSVSFALPLLFRPVIQLTFWPLYDSVWSLRSQHSLQSRPCRREHGSR
jgi:hypothetical protein